MFLSKPDILLNILYFLTALTYTELVNKLDKFLFIASTIKLSDGQNNE